MGLDFLWNKKHEDKECSKECPNCPEKLNAYRNWDDELHEAMQRKFGPTDIKLTNTEKLENPFLDVDEDIDGPDILPERKVVLFSNGNTHGKMCVRKEWFDTYKYQCNNFELYEKAQNDDSSEMFLIYIADVGEPTVDFYVTKKDTQKGD